MDAGTSLDDDLDMTRHHMNRNRLGCLGLSVLLLGGSMALTSGCDKQAQTVDLTQETKALENTSNKGGKRFKKSCKKSKASFFFEIRKGTQL